jgi:hypothetical protein
MELCSKCPMKDERYLPSNQEDKIRISQLKVQVARMSDFIEYLFEHSEHCDHITYNEAWEEFNQWEESQLPND